MNRCSAYLVQRAVSIISFNADAAVGVVAGYRWPAFAIESIREGGDSAQSISFKYRATAAIVGRCAQPNAIPATFTDANGRDQPVRSVISVAGSHRCRASRKPQLNLEALQVVMAVESGPAVRLRGGVQSAARVLHYVRGAIQVARYVGTLQPVRIDQGLSVGQKVSPPGAIS